MPLSGFDKAAKDDTVIEKIDHIGIMVKDLEATVNSLKQLGLKEIRREVVNKGDINVKTCFIRIGDVNLEIVQSLESDRGPCAKFIAEKGEGIHHLALKVKNIEKTVNILGKKGLPTPREAPHKATGGSRVVWLPKEAVSAIPIHLSEYPETTK